MEDPVPLGPLGLSYTEALMDQSPLEYFDWCSAFLQHSTMQQFGIHMPSVPQQFTFAPQLYNQPFVFDLPVTGFKPQLQNTLAYMPLRDTINDNAVVPKLEPPASPPLSYALQVPSPSSSISSPASSAPASPLSPLPPMISAIPPVAQHRATTIPEFIHSPLGSENLQVTSDTVIWHLQEPLHRNYYHTINFRVPTAAYATSPNGVGANYEGYRIYIHPQLGYSGNAKRFKQAPEPGEKAFILEGMVLDHHFQPIQQCAACMEYFENKSYFVANPHCKGRILLVKNNQVTRIKQNVFSLNMKPMCCSRHHQSPFYFYFILRDTQDSRVVTTSLFMCHVKQWKKTSSSNSLSLSASGSNSNKKRKMSGSPSANDSDSSSCSL